MPAVLVALLLACHGLIHASFLSPAPPATPGGPSWPFHLDRSWALSPLGLEPGLIRLVGFVLIVVTVASYLAAAIAFVGVGPSAWFAPAVVVGSVASLAVLAAFFSPWFLLGLAIDALLLWAVLANGWASAAGS